MKDKKHTVKCEDGIYSADYFFYDNGVTSEIIHYKKELYHGRHEFFYINGNSFVLFTYKDGIRKGTFYRRKKNNKIDKIEFSF